jgi:hypothetical protein
MLSGCNMKFVWTAKKIVVWGLQKKIKPKIQIVPVFASKKNLD